MGRRPEAATTVPVRSAECGVRSAECGNEKETIHPILEQSTPVLGIIPGYVKSPIPFRIAHSALRTPHWTYSAVMRFAQGRRGFDLDDTSRRQTDQFIAKEQFEQPMDLALVGGQDRQILRNTILDPHLLGAESGLHLFEDRLEGAAELDAISEFGG